MAQDKLIFKSEKDADVPLTWDEMDGNWSFLQSLIRQGLANLAASYSKADPLSATPDGADLIGFVRDATATTVAAELRRLATYLGDFLPPVNYAPGLVVDSYKFTASFQGQVYRVSPNAQLPFVTGDVFDINEWVLLSAVTRNEFDTLSYIASGALQRAGGTMLGKLTLAHEATEDLEAVAFKQLKTAGGVPLLHAIWSPSRTAIPTGYVPADGQILSRALYPDAWAGINAGVVPKVADSTWNLTPAERGKFTDGDGATTFRVPDYNGKSGGSLGAVFQRGDGALTTGQSGTIVKDAVGTADVPIATNSVTSNSLTPAYNGSKSRLAAGYQVSGEVGWNGTYTDSYTAGTTQRTNSINFGSTDTHPVYVTGCWVIRLFGAVINPGAADAAQLATEVANLQSKKADRQSVLGVGYMLVRDEKPSGIGGGASIVGNQTRTLNTVVANTITGATLSGNGITLPAGTYRILASSPTLAVNVIQAYLYNVTANTVLARGTSENGMSPATGDPCTVKSLVQTRVTFATTTVIELRQYCGEANSIGLGAPVTQGTEVYSSVEIIQE